LLELPPLRIPSLGNALRQTVRHGREFFARVLSLVVLCSVLVWLLSSLSPRLAPVDRLEDSLLGQLAGLLSPLLAPCGFGSREAAAALVTGLLAKESIVSTLAVLAGSRGAAGVFASPLAAFSFLLFVLLYTPCVAASQMICEELNEPGTAFRREAGRLLAAWGISMLVFQTGTLLGLG
jgi:ferrous iron transport protein B